MRLGPRLRPSAFSHFLRFGCPRFPCFVQQTSSNPYCSCVSVKRESWELRNIYHHHPESKKRKSSEANSGSIHPYGRYENAVKTRETISTIAILWPVKAIFEKRAATVEVDTLISLGENPHFPRFRLEQPELQSAEKPTDQPYLDRHCPKHLLRRK